MLCVHIPVVVVGGIVVVVDVGPAVDSVDEVLVSTGVVDVGSVVDGVVVAVALVVDSTAVLRENRVELI